MSAELDALKAALVHNTAVSANIVSVVGELRSQIKTLIAVSQSSDTAALPDLTAQITAATAALDALADPVVAIDVPATPPTTP